MVSYINFILLDFTFRTVILFGFVYVVKLKRSRFFAPAFFPEGGCQIVGVQILRRHVSFSFEMLLSFYKKKN